MSNAFKDRQQWVGEDLKTKQVTVGGNTYTAWDTSNVTDMSGMFWGDVKFGDYPQQDYIGNWDTSNVEDMSNMFHTGLWIEQPINTKQVTVGGNTYTAWNVGNVKNMSMMFYMAGQFNEDIGDWDVSKVENMYMMFKDCAAFNNGGASTIGNWVTSEVTNMHHMFYDGHNFNQDISAWDVGKVVYCGDFDLSAYNTSWTFDEKPVFTLCAPGYSSSSSSCSSRSSSSSSKSSSSSMRSSSSSSVVSGAAFYFTIVDEGNTVPDGNYCYDDTWTAPPVTYGGKSVYSYYDGSTGNTWYLHYISVGNSTTNSYWAIGNNPSGTTLLSSDLGWAAPEGTWTGSGSNVIITKIQGACGTGSNDNDGESDDCTESSDYTVYCGTAGVGCGSGVYLKESYTYNYSSVWKYNDGFTDFYLWNGHPDAYQGNGATLWSFAQNTGGTPSGESTANATGDCPHTAVWGNSITVTHLA